LLGATPMSALCQKRTHAVQQKAVLTGFVTSAFARERS
jgi:hypothetical protein